MRAGAPTGRAECGDPAAAFGGASSRGGDDAVRIGTGAVGVLLMAMGFESIADGPWFAWMDIALGVLALLSAHAAGWNAAYLAPLGPIAVGAGAMLLCIAAALAGVSRALIWGTLAAGLLALGLGALPVLAVRRRRTRP